MRRVWWIASGVVVLVAVVAAGAALGWWRPVASHKSTNVSSTLTAMPTSSRAPTPSPTVTDPYDEHPLTDTNAGRIESAIVSQDASVVGTVLTADVAQAVAADRTGPLLPAGSTLTIDQTSFVGRGDVATVSATVDGPQPGQWLLTLMWENQTWTVAGAVTP